MPVSNVIPLRPHRAAPPPPTAAEVAALERAVRHAKLEARTARTRAEYDIARARHCALCEELAQVRGRKLVTGEVA